MTRFQRLTFVTLGCTYLLVVIGALVRATGSGMGCPDWPLCYQGVLPPLTDWRAWLEWTHRATAVLVGLLVLGTAVLAVRHHRAQPAIVVPAVGALALTGFQAVLGKITVETNNSGASVTAHLTAAMLLLGVLAYLAVRGRYPAALPSFGAGQRFTLLAAFGALSVFALLLFGSHVTATRAALVFPDWPLFGGRVLPEFSADPARRALEVIHFLHRLAAAVVGLIVLAVAAAAWRLVGARGWGAAVSRPTLVALTSTTAALYAVQVIVGALQIMTVLAPWAVVLHLALGAAIWGLLVATTVHAYCESRVATTADEDLPAGDLPAGGQRRPDSGRDRRAAGAEPALEPRVSAAVATSTRGQRPALSDRARAYLALTKPRIIELLLVTTVPAMVLAARGVPRLDLVLWTLLGGALAAGSANAINCYLDRDIDELMARTRRRPLPAHEVTPENALLFGLTLGVLSFAELAVAVNLLSAFLALLAIAFYVVVYTLLMKRSTPQNIVIGGAAGALPPVIGWAAVSGDVTLPALLLMAIVFYWTPPHFWALSLRLARDYRAAGVPMLPVVRGVPETTRQILLHALVMVALTLALFAAARMGLIYLVGAVVLGTVFVTQALRMWREGTDARAVRLYRSSISYLTALFALITVDVLVPIGL